MNNRHIIIPISPDTGSCPCGPNCTCQDPNCDCAEGKCCDKCPSK